jgi:type VI secretion system secreted protein VgrG
MRLIQIRNALLDADCIALGLTLRERMSVEPYYQLELVSPQADLDLDGLLGSVMGIDIDLDEGAFRPLHTHVVAAYDTGQMDDKYTYTLELGSWLSFLAENRNCRIFQNLTVPQIVEQVFTAHNRTDFIFALEHDYEPREYCVQFLESDLQFVKRLLEAEGIYFYVKHDADRHVVVMSDTQKFDELIPAYASMLFLPDGEEQRAIAGREGVQRLQRSRRIRPNNVALRDFDYHVPGKRLDSDAQVEQAALHDITLQHYDYGTGYFDPARGEYLARIRLEAMQAESHMLQGVCNARGLHFGAVFSLQRHPDASRNRRYHVIGVEQVFTQDGPDSSSSGRNVGATFWALPDDRPFRPLLKTRRPTVPGIQSATVVGPDQSEVHTDKLGRIRVHFHWDRYKNTEEDASCWIRVSQAWAGKGWGVIAMPRVGQEVLVTYVDGDLDRPLVTGIVYNGDNPTPYDLPKDIRYSGMVTRSLKHGKYQHASQLTFDDQRGAERVMIHAERDLQQTVERNSSKSVGQDLNLQVAQTITTTTSNSVTYKDVSITYTGLSISFTGTALAYRGVAMTQNGKNTTMNGMNTTFNGTNTTFNGVNTVFNGVNTTFNGINTVFNGVTTAINGLNTQINGVAVNMTGISTAMTGVATAMVGARKTMVGTDLGIAGTVTTIRGSSTNVIGSEVSTKGTVVNYIGSEVSTKTSVVTDITSEVVTKGSVNATIGYEKVFKETSVSHIVNKLEFNDGKIKFNGKEVGTYGVQIKN